MRATPFLEDGNALVDTVKAPRLSGAPDIL